MMAFINTSCVLRGAVLALLCLLPVSVKAGALYDGPIPIYTNSSAYKIFFTTSTPSSSPVTIKAAVTPLSNYTLQMRDVILKPCGVIAMHIHPRGTEQAFVVSGSVEFGMFLENGTVVLVGATAGEVVVVPQGTVHYTRNVGCTSSRLVVVLNNPNPGLIFVGQALEGFPRGVVNSAFSGGFPSSTTGNLFSLKNCNCSTGG